MEDDADVKAADIVQAELALLSDISADSELTKLPPSRQHVHVMFPSNNLSQVCQLDS